MDLSNMIFTDFDFSHRNVHCHSSNTNSINKINFKSKDAKLKDDLSSFSFLSQKLIILLLGRKSLKNSKELLSTPNLLP